MAKFDHVKGVSGPAHLFVGLNDKRKNCISARKHEQITDVMLLILVHTTQSVNGQAHTNYRF